MKLFLRQGKFTETGHSLYTFNKIFFIQRIYIHELFPKKGTHISNLLCVVVAKLFHIFFLEKVSIALYIMKLQGNLNFTPYKFQLTQRRLELSGNFYSACFSSEIFLFYTEKVTQLYLGFTQVKRQ